MMIGPILKYHSVSNSTYIPMKMSLFEFLSKTSFEAIKQF
jgi:hypothetical protein